MLIPVWVVGSWMTIFTDGQKGDLVGTSPEPARVCLDVSCLFQEQSEGGGGGGGGGKGVWSRP